MLHEFKTEMRFYPDRFPELLRHVAEQLTREIDNLASPR